MEEEGLASMLAGHAQVGMDESVCPVCREWMLREENSGGALEQDPRHQRELSSQIMGRSLGFMVELQQVKKNDCNVLKVRTHSYSCTRELLLNSFTNIFYW